MKNQYLLLPPKLSDLMRTIEEHASTHCVFTIDRDFMSDNEDKLRVNRPLEMGINSHSFLVT